jgi:thiol-disulfide isomerase/thioredoxin
MKNRLPRPLDAPLAPAKVRLARRALLRSVLGLATLAAAAPAAWARTPGEVPVGAPLRDATMTGLTVPFRKLSDFRGKPLIINVWASWCGPCRVEMGSLERLSRRKGAQAFTVIGISTDDYPEAALGFVQKTGTTFAHFIDQKLVLENMLGADRLPLTVLVDAQGRVVDKVYGAREWDSPESVRLVSKALGVPL